MFIAYYWISVEKSGLNLKMPHRFRNDTSKLNLPFFLWQSVTNICDFVKEISFLAPRAAFKISTWNCELRMRMRILTYGCEETADYFNYRKISHTNSYSNSVKINIKRTALFTHRIYFFYLCFRLVTSILSYQSPWRNHQLGPW